MSSDEQTRDVLLDEQDELMSRFAYGHLPPALQDVSKPFSDLAGIVVLIGRGPSFDRVTCLRKLLEAKDCAVRAALDSGPLSRF